MSGYCCERLNLTQSYTHSQEDFNKARVLVTDAAKSGSYLYPIKGIVYFMTHRALWQPFLSKIGPTLALSLGVLGSMFALTYLPQLAVLVFVNGPLAVFTTVLLILSESSTIVSTVSRTWMLQDALLESVHPLVYLSRDS